jgi:hypothetical protein
MILWHTPLVKVTLRLTVSHSVSLGVEPHLGLMTRYLLLFDSYGLVFVGRPLWREDGSVFCKCCWPLPAQCFSGPSPLVLPTIFYCLRFETSFFVASYDSQGHGGGIRPRLHTGLKVKVTLRLRLHTGLRAEQSRAVAYCRQPASTVTLGIEPRGDPWPYICSVSRLLFFLLSLLLLW